MVLQCSACTCGPDGRLLAIPPRNKARVWGAAAPQGGSGEGDPQDKARGLGGLSPAGYGVILNIECAIRTEPIESN